MFGVRDQQRKKVYNWERQFTDFYKVELTLSECDELIHKALIWWFRNNEERKVYLKDGRGTRSARGGSSVISLPAWARGRHVVLHETAHCIVERMGHRYEDGGHGPYFMRVFIELLGHFLKYDRTELTRSAKAVKVKVKPVKYLKRPVKSNRNYRPVKKSTMRTCGCGARGRHKKECVLRLPTEKTPEPTKLHNLYIQGYGEPPHLTWFHNKSKQTIVERRIISLVKRYKSFYLNIADENEVWYIDGGNWASQHYPRYNKFIGHIKNILPFLNGAMPITWGDWNRIPEEIKPKRKRK